MSFSENIRIRFENNQAELKLDNLNSLSNQTRASYYLVRETREPNRVCIIIIISTLFLYYYIKYLILHLFIYLIESNSSKTDHISSFC